jgi:hypothetical protein
MDSASGRLTSKKWAVPLAPSASALDPASIHNPTVDVDIPGIVSVDTDSPLLRTEVLVTGSEYFAGVANVLASN